MRFYHVGFARAWCVNKSIVSFVNIILHGFLMLESCIFMLDQSSHRRRVGLSSLLIVLVDSLIEALTVVIQASLVQLL